MDDFLMDEAPELPADLQAAVERSSRIMRVEGEGQLTPPQLIKAEANLLRFPLFALSTKGLANVDQIECLGTTRVGDDELQFKLSVSRNTRYQYPGPLARKVHFALLSLIYDSGFPFENPLVFTWRELCKRMQISYSGEKIDRLKDAIRSITGVVLTTQNAFKQAGDKTPLAEREAGYQLYTGYEFYGERMEDGSIARRNFLWLADWYVRNLNAFYVAPVNYDLWSALNEHSPIASRLYEFLLFNFAGRHPSLLINYTTLAQFLPVRSRRYLADARTQLAKPLYYLVECGIVRDVEWTTGKHGDIQLRFFPGEQLVIGPPQERLSLAELPLPDKISVREIRRRETPAEAIVAQFHKLWGGPQNYKATTAEIAFAEELLDQHGRKLVERLLPQVVKTTQQEFPKAKMFNGSRRYFAAALLEYERREKVAAREAEQGRQRILERQRAEAEARRIEELNILWQQLPTAEREQIEADVTAANPPSFRKFKNLVLRSCLHEMARRKGLVADEPSSTFEA